MLLDRISSYFRSFSAFLVPLGSEYSKYPQQQFSNILTVIIFTIFAGWIYLEWFHLQNSDIQF